MGLVTVGIDPSRVRTGWSIWRDEHLQDWGDIHTTPDEVLEIRIDRITTDLIRMVRRARPDLIAIESPMNTSRFKDARVSELHGVLKWRLWKRQYLFTFVAANSLKLFGAGKGNASKAEMLAAARLYDSGIPHHDVADAVHLGRWASSNYGRLVEDG